MSSFAGFLLLCVLFFKSTELVREHTYQAMNQAWAWTIASISLLSILSIFGFYARKPQTADITFLSGSDTAKFLKSDTDGYVKGLSIIDLRARGHSAASGVTDYIQTVSENVHNFTDLEKRRLIMAAQKADSDLSRKATTPRELATIPWVIAATNDAGKYEGGHPHTRGNVIFLTPSIIRSANIVETLIHEKVHVFQRLAKDYMNNYLTKKGFLPYATRAEFILLNPRLRANPDLDDRIWIDTKTRKLFLAEYTTEHPASIDDIIQVNPAFEHPYEAMAYKIAQAISKNN